MGIGTVSMDKSSVLAGDIHNESLAGVAFRCGDDSGNIDAFFLQQ